MSEQSNAGVAGSGLAMELISAATQQDGRWDAFDADVPRDGYRWWYVDALSDDGRTGLTLIAMLGSVFSPYYVRQRRRGPADPLHHCALNVALYGRPARRWALTERGVQDIDRGSDYIRFGPSHMQWRGDSLHFHLDERSAVLGRSMRGHVVVTPRMQTSKYLLLNPIGQHCWWPIAPRCDVQVKFSNPSVAWHGTGYLDSNFGQAPLERGFRFWDWSRAALPSQRTAILYNVHHRDGESHSVALDIDRDGELTTREPPPETEARRGFWGVRRATRADDGRPPQLVEIMEDTPFYTRSALATSLFGEQVHAMHESLDLDRFQAPWVQALIPVRNPRRSGPTAAARRGDSTPG